MTATALQDFIAQNQNIRIVDDLENFRLLCRNESLPWYQSDPDRCTAITYDKADDMTCDELMAEINRGLRVEGITRITGYFTKTSTWNKGKLAELKDRRRMDLSGREQCQPCVPVADCEPLPCCGNGVNQNGGCMVLDRLSDRIQITREYYGDEKEKPNDHCFYDGGAFIPGWYETDTHLRERIKQPK